MTNQRTTEYEITVKVQSRFLMTIPVADFAVHGRLRREEDFAQQIGKIFAEHLTRVRPTLEKARAHMTESPPSIHEGPPVPDLRRA